MIAFVALETEGLVHLIDVGSDQAFCGIYIVCGIEPEGSTDCCSECIELLYEKTGIDINSVT